MKNTKKDFTKFTKRNVHKRRSKDAAKRELLRAVRECGADISSVKIKDSFDRGRGGRQGARVRRDETVTRGIFSSSKSGFGFVSPEEGGRDIFIPEDRTLGAVHGDFVEVVYHAYQSRLGEEKTEGRVTKILQFGRKSIIGTVTEQWARHGRRMYRYFVLIPDDPKITLRPSIADMGGAKEGDKVEAIIIRDGSTHPECRVERIFGDTESREANYEAILAESEIPVEFTPEELACAREVAAEPLSYEGRVLRDKEFILTIDGEGAKDLDDAVSLCRTAGGGFRLGVHIADVSHYVRERTPLDRCAMARGTSVYFTDKVVPMLPVALSNGVCSLNAGEDKYALSAIISIDGKGEIVKAKIEPSVIRSRVRGVYSEVNALLAGEADEKIKKKYKDAEPTLKKMAELYELLRARSLRRGYVDFDAAEAEIVLGEDGFPVDIVRRERGLSERIIEQFMLVANEAVATLLFDNEIPCVYRVHEAPPSEKLTEFLTYVYNLGLDGRVINKDKPDALGLSRLLCEAEEKGLLAPVSYSMLRSMAKAKYSEERADHFGLGLSKYCHFTSPIRRLSDLATHRIIKKVLFECKRAESYRSYSRRAAAAATEAELRALSAERRIENLYKVLYMTEHIGECFDAVVSSVTGFGLFCELENTCEGLVPISEMPGMFVYDEKNVTLRSRDKIYRLADRVKILVEEADIVRGKLRFSLVEEDYEA